MSSKRLKLAFTVAGTVIGAGFATGKELMMFFQNEPISLVFLCLAMLVMACVCLLYFAQQKDSSFLPETSFLKKTVRMLFQMFSGASYTVMLACGGEALRESVGLWVPAGTVMTWAITMGIVFFGTQNVYRFNLIATPLLLICMTGISLAGLLSPTGLFGASYSPTVNLLLYSGYNLLSVLPVLDALHHTVKKQEGYSGIFWGFFLVTAMGLLLKGLLLRFSHLTAESSIPVLSVVSHCHSNLNVFYTAMLYLSILTTAVNSLYAVIKEKNPLTVGILLLGCSFLGFTALIETLYPLFGYLGIGVILMIIGKVFIKPTGKDEHNVKRKKCDSEYHFRKPRETFSIRRD